MTISTLEHRQRSKLDETLFLENGDRLTRAEFERRYSAHPEIEKAELIEGVVYMSSPVRLGHGRPHSYLMYWLTSYCAATPGVDVGDNVTVRLDEDNEFQPDALLRLDPRVGGRSRVSEDDFIEGPPELVAEVAVSSASYDLHGKLNVYRRAGVQEYVVWPVFEKRLEWFELREGQYVPLTAAADGLLYSRVFPGLALLPEALLAGDLARVLAALQTGLARPEHAAFLDRLRSAT